MGKRKELWRPRRRSTRTSLPPRRRLLRTPSLRRRSCRRSLAHTPTAHTVPRAHSATATLVPTLALLLALATATHMALAPATPMALAMATHTGHTLAHTIEFAQLAVESLRLRAPIVDQLIIFLTPKLT